jgi:hypothetical protein
MKRRPKKKRPDYTVRPVPDNGVSDAEKQLIQELRQRLIVDAPTREKERQACPNS